MSGHLRKMHVWSGLGGLCCAAIALSFTVAPVANATAASRSEIKTSEVGTIGEWVASRPKSFFENQERVLKLRAWVSELPNIADSSIREIINKENTGVVILAWASMDDPLLKKVEAKAIELGLQPKIELRKHSKKELSATADAILAKESSLNAQGITLGSVGISPYSDDAEVKVDVSWKESARLGPKPKITEAAESFIAQETSNVKVELKEKESAKSLSRTYDYSPFWGGGFMRYTDYRGRQGTCSTGFSVWYQGAAHPTAADHCHGDNFRSYGGVNGPGAFVGDTLAWDNGTDSKILTGRGEGRILNGGPQGSDSMKVIGGYSDYSVGDWLCTSGGNSGVHCDIVIDEVDVSRSISSDDGVSRRILATIAHRSGGGVAAMGGDSGSPVLAPMGGGVIVAGNISAGSNEVSCGSYNLWSRCYNTVYFVKLSRVLARWGASLVTG